MSWREMDIRRRRNPGAGEKGVTAVNGSCDQKEQREFVSPKSHKKVKKPEPLYKRVLLVAASSVFPYLAACWLLTGFAYLDTMFGKKPLTGIEAQVAEIRSKLTTLGRFEARIDEFEAKMMEIKAGLMAEKEEMKATVEFDLGSRLKRLEEESVHFDEALLELKGTTTGAIAAMTKIQTDFSVEAVKFMAEEIVEMHKNHTHLTLEDVRVIAEEIADKGIERHAADGIGLPDYALASVGARVVGHSKPFIKGKNAKVAIHEDAVMMLQPSFGEFGQDFCLDGNTGFVEIMLPAKIVPQAITLEHMAKSVAYDPRRPTAPRECRVSAWSLETSGWRKGRVRGEIYVLAEFTYSLEKKHIQTIPIDHSMFSFGGNMVNMIRLDVFSNYGSVMTCISRLRVHGREPF